MKASGIGGQAVIEGVMMKNGSEYAVSVRTPDGQIETMTDTFVSAGDKLPILKWPILRGVVAFIDSLSLGMKTLTYSSSFFEEEEEEEPSKLEQAMEKRFGEKSEKVVMGGTIFLSILLAIVIFMLVPFFLSSLLGKVIQSETILIILEGIIRVGIFVLYVLLISKMEEIKRVFMYHGAEHKCINCVENGLPLTVANVKKQGRQHRRCGTSFLLYVMLISIILFMFIRVSSPWLRILFRLLLIPVIAGISYEFIRLAGRSDNICVRIFSKPGLWLQSLTTKEPTDEMIEVGIASVEAVFDWREFIKGVTAEDQMAERKARRETRREQKKQDEEKRVEKTWKEIREEEEAKRQAERPERPVRPAKEDLFDGTTDELEKTAPVIEEDELDDIDDILAQYSSRGR
ncbi:MAG: DUF1385 domain-containing protein [Lachnospiraceae bacterium]|nr:DUF1385 domain-containing protein [Lachnospiraceae bacterium]